jgi:hypothetical protein
MNPILACVFILCVIFGIYSGFQEMAKVRKYPKYGVKPSKNLISFLFWDY